MSGALLAVWICLGCAPGKSPPTSVAPAPGPARDKPAGAVASAIRLDNIARQVGVDFIYRNDEQQGRASILEVVGGGVALLDYDLDGYLEIFFPGGGQYAGPRELRGRPSELFRRQAGGRYERVATLAGASDCQYYSHGAAASDVNNDGFCDLLVTGYGGLTLLVNQGDGTFIETARTAGLNDTSWSTSAAWGDLDQDGAPDLYVAHYLNWSFDNDPRCFSRSGERDWCSPQEFQPLPDTVYLNNQDGTFRDASRQLGLRDDGKGLGVVIADLDLDRDLDVYVANDATPNFLYRNNGAGSWSEVGIASGSGLDKTGVPDGSMGVDVGDFNGDGLVDLWVVNFEQETFAMYQNFGQCLFLHATDATGLAAEAGLYVGWGTALYDLDRDADLDIVVANGHAFLHPTHAPRRQLPLVFENLAGKRFQNVAAQAGEYTSQAHDGRGLAVGDLDNDGAVDVVISHINEAVAVLRNSSAPQGHWIGMKLIGRHSARDAVGAVVRVKTAQREQLAQIAGGGSYLSTSDRRLVFGLGNAATIESIAIDWPSGRRQSLSGVSADQYLIVIEAD